MFEQKHYTTNDMSFSIFLKHDTPRGVTTYYSITVNLNFTAYKNSNFHKFILQFCCESSKIITVYLGP